MNWIAIFNRLFELINKSPNDANYYSGPMFLDVIRGINYNLPSYKEYIDQRNAEYSTANNTAALAAEAEGSLKKT